MTAPAIHTEHLRKEFGDKVAVADLSLQVERGEVFGFLGPNGAGKTTSVKMLLGLVTPTGGSARVLGASPGDPRARARVGFLPEHFRFHAWLTAAEFMTLHADLYGLPRQMTAARAPALLDLVGLAPHAHQTIGTFSKGMLQRVGLAQALLSEPELVILDEPTSGLDPVGRRMVRDIIGDLRNRGAAVFLNSHFLSEVEVTCDRVAFIKHGEVVQSSSLQALTNGRLTVRARVRNLSAETVAGLRRWTPNATLDGETLSMTIAAEDDLPAVNRYLIESGAEVYAFHPQQASLEELFVEIVGTDGGL
ncbi:MAG: ATP-binding cassette domain-containing protein [Anaerolineales bacterium]